MGDNSWVNHRENGITYSFDATKCMFSSGNLSEKLRMSRLDCTNEIVVDLFAGIGYFSLPFLVKYKLITFVKNTPSFCNITALIIFFIFHSLLHLMYNLTCSKQFESKITLCMRVEPSCYGSSSI